MSLRDLEPDRWGMEKPTRPAPQGTRRTLDRREHWRLHQFLEMIVLTLLAAFVVTAIVLYTLG